MTIVIAIASVILICGIFFHAARRSECRAFNHGYCHQCGSPLQSFDMDSQGGRGYKCRSCPNYTIWVSYPNVDRDAVPRDLQLEGCVVIVNEQDQ